MEVRQLLAADAEAWFALQQREMPDPLTEPGLRAEFDSHRSLRLGLWRGDELSAVFLGWVVVDELQVIQIATASEARRQGLGARLLKAAIEQSEILGLEIAGRVLRTREGEWLPSEEVLKQRIKIEADKNNKITVTGADKQQVGQVAAKIRSFREPDHYKGKGVRYENERVRLKAGKCAK